MATLTGKSIATTYDQLWFRGTTEPSGTTGAVQVLTTENDGTDDLGTPLYLGTARVGIGTASPGAQLDISTSADGGVGGVLRLSNLDGTISTGVAGGAIEFYNNDDSGGAGVHSKILTRCTDNGGNWAMDFYTGEADALINAMTIFKDGNVGIGTASPGATLHIEQATEDDVAIFFDATGDVAHGMTLHGQTSTYGSIQKVGSVYGGLMITGLTDADSPGHSAVIIRAMQGEAISDIKSVNGQGCLRLQAYQKDDDDVTTPNSDANLVSIQSGSTTRFIFDAEGQMHSSVADTQTGMDSYEDAQLIRAFALNSFPKGVIESKFDEFIKYNHETLAELKLVGRDEDGTPNRFFNMTKMQQLHNGAIWQQYTEMQKMKELMYDTMVDMLGKEKADKKLNDHDIKLLN